jgi:hypothetical protein
MNEAARCVAGCHSRRQLDGARELDILALAPLSVAKAFEAALIARVPREREPRRAQARGRRAALPGGDRWW